MLGSGCCYGAIVPWWFVGAKQLASKWSLPLDSADALLLFPEGSIILVGPLMGIAIDRMAWSLPLRLALCALVLIVAVPTALLALAWAPTDRWLPTPLPPVILLGVGYACVQNLIWATITMLVPAEMTNLAAGLMGGALNLLPALLPLVAFSGDGADDLTVLSVVAAVGSLAFGAACARAMGRRAPGGGQNQHRENAAVAPLAAPTLTRASEA